MKTTKMLAILVLGLMFCLAQVIKAAPMGTSWTYQGHLMDANNPADGLYDFKFKLFDDPCAGTQQGSTIEIDDLDVVDGHLIVELDFGSSVFDGDARWLETTVMHADGSDPCKLWPRTEVTPLPYALQTRGLFVDDAGNVGIGTTSPKCRLAVNGGGLEVYAGSSGEEITFCTKRFHMTNSNEDIIMEAGEVPSDYVVFSNAGSEIMKVTKGGVAVGQAYTSKTPPNDGLIVKGNVGIGTTTPISSLEVISPVDAHAIRATTNYIPVYALRTATGGTWPAVAGDCNSEAGSASGVRGRILSTNPGSLGAGVYGYNYGTGSSGVGVRGHHAGSGSGVYGQCDDGKGVYGNSANGYGGYFVGAKNYFGGNVGIGTTSPAHKLTVNTSETTGRAISSEASASPGSGVVNYGGYFVSKGGRGKGVYGEASHTGDFQNEGGRFAACGKYGRGVYGNATGTDGRGVYGLASSSTGTNYGVYGNTYSSTGYAGYFDGRVHVAGTLTKSSGSFKIDHPLYPEEKYLQHSFVESPDMMNVYNGNAVLDENGEAVVKLPAYFEALNRDFRYQLTAVGAPAPNLYVAEEISDNRFKIAGGTGGMKVSWQVTGIRQDRYAQSHPIVVEEDKPVEARGYYLHPELYGYGEEKSIEAAQENRAVKIRQVAKEAD